MRPRVSGLPQPHSAPFEIASRMLTQTDRQADRATEIETSA